MTSEKESVGLGALIALTTIVFAISLAMFAAGEPQGASIVSNFTEQSPTNPPAARTDDGGTINFLNMSTTQQNAGWKAYVGNVTGRLTLDDANSNTIYDWSLGGSPSGEVYVARNDSVSWTNIACANQSTINSEDSALSKSASDSDSINNTFSNQAHAEMQVGGITINKDTCRSTATYINDSAQTVDENATFQEILLQDNGPHLVYATFIDQDEFNYQAGTNATYDFQMIIGEDESSGPTTYYFYLEIS